jgi:putative Mn2+ efflux pump MntP
VLKVAALVLPLCLDTFAISAAVGLDRPTLAARLRLGAVFAVFEGGMPLVGLGVGLLLANRLAGAADYLAAGVLVLAGLLMLREDEEREERRARGLLTGGDWRCWGSGSASAWTSWQSASRWACCGCRWSWWWR